MDRASLLRVLGLAQLIGALAMAAIVGLVLISGEEWTYLMATPVPFLLTGLLTLRASRRND
ncbi:hypothetical protein ABZ348_12860 [Streptomyces sp. NPDC005963]|uniref:hypothetical protein n=1 Tax=Streptomyces sp. NPDC005963 TaxID=3156721 RepID=UPI0033F28CC8